MNNLVSNQSACSARKLKFFAMIVFVCLAFTWCGDCSLCSAQPVNYEVLFTFNGDSYGDAFGSVVSNAGDVDNDGVADIVVGGRNAGPSRTGMARVFSGRTGETLYTFRGGSSFDRFGLSVSGAGDVNGDGFADILVGAPDDDNNNLQSSGSAQVFSGFDGTTLYTFNGAMTGTGLGQSVSSAGDVNRDGFADVLVGSPNDHLTGGLNQDGSVRVFSGNDGAELYEFRGGFRDQDGFGNDISNAGDVNNDGITDFIIGASFENSASVYSGESGALLYKFIASHNVLRVGGAGDVNGDNYDDLIIGTAAPDARVFSGFDGSVLHIFSGDQSDLVGRAVSGAGDVDGDGYGDLIVGAPHTADLKGAANLYSGRDGLLIHALLGDSNSYLFGVSVGLLGDINSDGRPDFVVGAFGGGANSGGFAKVFVSAPEPVLLGDTNLDGFVDFLDIAPFISVLSAGNFQAQADCDQSGMVDFLDIAPFISILSGQ